MGVSMTITGGGAENALDILTADDVEGSPGRSLNAAFTPNASRPTFGTYTGQIQGSANGDQGHIALEISPDGETWHSISRLRYRHAVDSAGLVSAPLSTFVPAGWQVRLVTTTVAGSPSFALAHQAEFTF